MESRIALFPVASKCQGAVNRKCRRGTPCLIQSSVCSQVMVSSLSRGRLKDEETKLFPSRGHRARAKRQLSAKNPTRSYVLLYPLEEIIETVRRYVSPRAYLNPRAVCVTRLYPCSIAHPIRPAQFFFLDQPSADDCCFRSSNRALLLESA